MNLESAFREPKLRAAENPLLSNGFSLEKNFLFRILLTVWSTLLVCAPLSAAGRDETEGRNHKVLFKRSYPLPQRTFRIALTIISLVLLL